VDITEKLETVVPLPDSGYAARHEDGGGGSHQAPQTSSSLLELERYLASSSADLPLAARPCLGESPVVAARRPRLMGVSLIITKLAIRWVGCSQQGEYRT
jgi:hypothetical protein